MVSVDRRYFTRLPTIKIVIVRRCDKNIRLDWSLKSDVIPAGHARKFLIVRPVVSNSAAANIFPSPLYALVRSFHGK